MLRIAAADPGTIRVGGRFSGTATFGSEQPAETTLISTNATADGFIAAYDTAGTLLWARQTESASGAWGNGLATDGDGNTYVTGAMHGATTFGAGEPSETTLVATQVGDGFVAKYGPHDEYDIVKLLPHVQCPTLVLIGTESAKNAAAFDGLPADLERMAAGRPGLKVVTVEGAEISYQGHFGAPFEHMIDWLTNGK